MWLWSFGQNVAKPVARFLLRGRDNFNAEVRAVEEALPEPVVEMEDPEPQGRATVAGGGPRLQHPAMEARAAAPGPPLAHPAARVAAPAPPPRGPRLGPVPAVVRRRGVLAPPGVAPAPAAPAPANPPANPPVRGEPTRDYVERVVI